MKKFNTLILFAALAVFLGSCSIEKRVHNKGFHVQWNKKYKANKHQNVDKQELAVNTEESSEILKKERFEPKIAQVEDSNYESVDAVNANQSVVYTEKDEVHTDVQNSPLDTDVSTFEVQEESSHLPASNQTLRQTKKKAKRSAADGDTGSSGSSQIVALILVIFLGLLGVHRFYLGYTGVGVLMLLTAGLFGILALIDLIRIAVGDLKPKRGDYTEKL